MSPGSLLVLIIMVETLNDLDKVKFGATQHFISSLILLLLILFFLFSYFFYKCCLASLYKFLNLQVIYFLFIFIFLFLSFYYFRYGHKRDFNFWLPIPSFLHSLKTSNLYNFSNLLNLSYGWIGLLFGLIFIFFE